MIMKKKKKKKKMTKKKDCSGSHHNSKFKNGKKDKYEKSSFTTYAYLLPRYTVHRKKERASDRSWPRRCHVLYQIGHD